MTTECVRCVECGEVEELRWIEERNDRLRTRSACFTCCFWLDRIDNQQSDPELCIVNGFAYAARPRDDRSPKSCLGFAGTEFCFVFNDGRVIRTNNAYGQGEVPERFRERLPDTATLGHVCEGNPRRCKVYCPSSVNGADS